jgi:hypothetical protein
MLKNAATGQSVQFGVEQRIGEFDRLKKLNGDMLSSKAPAKEDEAPQ